MQRVSDIIVDMLDINRFEIKDVKLNLQQVEIGALIENEISLLKPRFKQAQLNFAKHKKAQVSIDKHKFREVLTNLISNAVQYAGEKPKINIELLTGPKYVTIKVADNGLGISRKDLNKIFERFYRADSAKLVRPSGSGLGLFLVKMIIEAHGGSISVSSKKGLGSTFTLKLPRR